MSWAQAFRDMVIAAINRGQLPIFGFFVLLLALIVKMPNEGVSKLVFEILGSLHHGELVGYILCIIIIFFWYAHVRIMRKSFSAEFKRIGQEKSSLQSKLANVPFESSDHK